MKPCMFLCLLLTTVAAFGGDLTDALVRQQTLDALQTIQRQQRDAFYDAQLQAIWNRSSCLKDPLLSPSFDRKPRENPFYFWQ